MGMSRITEWNRRENWLFLFAAIGAGRTLWEWFNPQKEAGVMPFGCPSCPPSLWLLALSVITLGMCAYGFYLSTRTQRRYEAKLLIERDKANVAQRQLREADWPLMTAGRLTLLAEDAELLEDAFDQIIESNAADKHPIDLTFPLTIKLVGLELGKDIPQLSWQCLRLMSFRDGYNSHRAHLMNRALPNFESAVLKCPMPCDLDQKTISGMLISHKAALKKRAYELAAPYIEAKLQASRPDATPPVLG